MIKIHTLDLNFLNTPETIAAFLIESSEGPILFECGPHSAIEGLKAEVKRVGYDLTDIRHLFLTHIHFDHAGAAWALAKNGTKVYVHPRGYKHLKDPSRLYSSAERIYGDQMEYLWGKMEGIEEEYLEEISDNEVYKIGEIGIKALHTPGHASHHIAFKVDDFAIVGDVGGCKIDGGPVVPPCPPPDINIEDWINSIDRLLSEELQAIYLTHFGVIENIESHMQALKDILWDWANFIKPHFEKQTSLEELTSIFAAYAKTQLESAGVKDASLLGKYEKANPAWMSVAGLMRYWTKKADHS